VPLGLLVLLVLLAGLVPWGLLVELLPGHKPVPVITPSPEIKPDLFPSISLSLFLLNFVFCRFTYKITVV